MKKGKRSRTVVLAAAAAAVVVAALAGGILFGRKWTARQASQRNEYEQALLGRWAYIHDLKTKAVSFKANGRAEYEGKKYDFSCDGRYICFTDEAGEAVMRLRYTQDEDGICLYTQNRYVLEDGGAPEGIVGVWVCPEKNWIYEFTKKGTFLEDSILTGHYFVDEEKGTIRLDYEAVLDDTILYYQLTDDGLLVEYPWPMRRM